MLLWLYGLAEDQQGAMMATGVGKGPKAVSDGYRVTGPSACSCGYRTRQRTCWSRDSIADHNGAFVAAGIVKGEIRALRMTTV